MAKSEYFRDRHLIAVTDAARRAGVKGAALAVLSYLCSASAFTKPTVCVSKARIVERTGYSEKTVKGALASLRAVGCIEAVACLEGGRHRATIYKLTAQAGKGGENFPPNDQPDEKGGNFSRKGGKFFPERGEETTPPSISSSISSSRREKGRGLDAPDAGPHGPLLTPDRAEAALFAREHAEFGIAEAMARSKARRAAAA
jgi:hypothetical protein